MGFESGNLNRWRTARERNRLKARYEIQARVSHIVQSELSSNLNVAGDNTSESASDCHPGCNLDTLSYLNIILRYLQAIIKNDLSTFSVVSLFRDGPILNDPLPHVFTKRSFMEMDLSNGIPTGGMKSVEEAMFALSMFLSTKCQWDDPSHLEVQTKIPIPIEQNVPFEWNGSSGQRICTSSSPIVHKRLSPNLQFQPSTLATSKYGTDFVRNRLVPYMQRQQLTLLEYASLLGRHSIVGSLIMNGIDPTKRCHHLSVTSFNKVLSQKCLASTKCASRKVLALIHSVNGNPWNDVSETLIPLSLWSFIIRSVIEMRLNGDLRDTSGEWYLDQHYQDFSKCPICQNEFSLSYRSLIFGPPCYHILCEPCIWTHLVHTVPKCTNIKQIVVTCPLCSVEFKGFQYLKQSANQKIERQNTSEKENYTNRTLNTTTPMGRTHEDYEEGENSCQHDRERRRLDSLIKFMVLPATSSEVKLMSKVEASANRRKRERDPIHATWEEALMSVMNGHLSKDVRSDRFFRAIITSHHLVMGYLITGIDVNMQNDYGQTPLYIACWKGSPTTVQCLLEYGADFTIAANGGSTCWSVARKLLRHDVMSILEMYGTECGIILGDSTLTLRDSRSDNLNSCDEDSSCSISFLIDPAKDHPGAGACIVDNALSENQLKELDQLWRTLSIEDSFYDEEQVQNVNAKINVESDKYKNRPTRSYYCDSEQIVQTMLEKCIDKVRRALNPRRQEKRHLEQREYGMKNNSFSPPTSVFPHLRFLLYQRKGILPPHVDLCRVDDISGYRSTHTFILYLTDCDEGGGTAILQDLKDPKVLKIIQPKRGRVFMFPHLCPHAGLEVDSDSKLLLRGEVRLT